jgi:hypothetical protein
MAHSIFAGASHASDAVFDIQTAKAAAIAIYHFCGFGKQ